LDNRYIPRGKKYDLAWKYGFAKDLHRFFFSSTRKNSNNRFLLFLCKRKTILVFCFSGGKVTPKVTLIIVTFNNPTVFFLEEQNIYATKK
jgi:hypothetical protein